MNKNYFNSGLNTSFFFFPWEAIVLGYVFIVKKMWFNAAIKSK